MHKTRGRKGKIITTSSVIKAFSKEAKREIETVRYKSEMHIQL